MPGKTFAGIILLALVFAFQTASAAIWHVSASVPQSGDGTSWESAFKKIQEGIDAASDEDTLLVAQGTYVENIQFHGKNIILTSTNPLNVAVVANTIIDGNQSGSVITFAGTEDETCVLSGFTTRNGYADYGGGIRGNGTRATVRDNKINGNSASLSGGGLHDCSGTIEDNVITGNGARWGGGLSGCGGIVQNNIVGPNRASDSGAGLYSCNGTLRNNTITGNSGFYRGGGLSDCHGIIRNNTIRANKALYGAGLAWCHGAILGNTISANGADFGGALYQCNGTIQNNLIAGNSAAYRDEGYGPDATIQNDIITENWVNLGGGLYGCNGTIQNNTVVGNSSGLLWCLGAIRNCIIWGNGEGYLEGQVRECVPPSFSCIQDWWGEGRENVREDPQFIDEKGGDYDLKETSPCRDAGVNYYWFAWPQCDLDGNCRLHGSRVDMGCYEYGASPDADGDLLCDTDETAAGTSPNLDDTDGDALRDGLEVLRGTSPIEATAAGVIQVPADMPAIQGALCVAMGADEIVVAAGTYGENLEFPGVDVTLRSSDPDDPAVVFSAIIDGGAAGSVICFAGAETEACVLSGLTIRNGMAPSGGGIRGKGTRATIRNNTIVGNSVSDYGGGLYDCQGAVQNNTISGNSACWGGGLSLCHGTIHGNTISGNSAGHNGGGLYLCSGSVMNNSVSGNSARWGGGLSHCAGTIHDNTISGNSASDAGAGLSECDGTIHDNTISENKGYFGAGLAHCAGRIQNNTISRNRADGGSVLHCCNGTIQNNTIAANSGCALYACPGTIRNCIIWGNVASSGGQLQECSAPSFSCIEGWTAGSDDNIAEDPQFVDAEKGDFRLLPDSPCIDAGFNDPDLPETDIVGMHRIMFGGKSLTVDMGAYEFYINDLAPGPDPDERTLTWSSLSDKTYSIFYSEDLLTWHLAVAIFPSSGNATTSWTDDGSQTGSRPGLVPRRFYRTLENQ